MPLNWRHPGTIVQEVTVSVPESRSFSFPKSRSKYLPDAVKIAKTLPGFEKSKKHYKVTFGKGDTAPEGLWELLKIAGHWKGSVYLIDGKAVDQEAWEKAFRDEATVAEEPAVEAEVPPVAEEAVVEEPEAPNEPDPSEPTPEPEAAATEAPAPTEDPVEEATEVEVSTEEVPEEGAPAEQAESKEPESKPDPVPEKKSPPKIVITPAPKPEDNSGCGKSAAVFMIAALGLLQLFR